MKYGEKQVALFFGNETSIETFEASRGIYHIECWGAKGCGTRGGLGGYVSGYIKITNPIPLYLYIGAIGQSAQSEYAFNGGGTGQGGGGGASDVRLTRNDDWSEIESLKSRIIVAGAGGGADFVWENPENGGSGGGLIGHNSSQNKGKGGTQTKGGDGVGKGQFGKGGSTQETGPSGNGAGGGGYFGGGSSNQTDNFGGGGGSSFISGHDGCLAINQESTDLSNMIMLNHSIHFSTMRFFKTDIIDGDSEMPSPYGGYEKGHSYAGAIRIHKLEPITCEQKIIPHSMRYFISLIYVNILFSNSS